MKRFILIGVLLGMLASFVSACGSSLPKTMEKASNIAKPTEPVFSCEDGPYYWASESKPKDIKVPYGETVVYPYIWGDMQWNATLGCDNYEYHVISDLPVLPESKTTIISCDEKTSFEVMYAKVIEFACQKSLLFGEEDKNPPQASIRLEYNGREMIFDLEYQIQDINHSDGSQSQYLDYLIWAGYLDDGSWVNQRCYTSHYDKYDLMGFAGSRNLSDSDETNFDAFCAGEGFALLMKTSR